MPATDNWFEEKQSAWLYHIMAHNEKDGVKQQLFLNLAEAAESQAQIWEDEVARNGEPSPSFKPTLRTRLVALLLRLFGARAIRPILAAMKIRGLSVYSENFIPSHHMMPTSVEQVGRRHKGYGGGKLRAAVFGVNDGLVSNTALIMGVAGATNETSFILAGGIAGMLAGAFSMAAGEYISMRSQREMYEYQIRLEREELEEYPDEEAEEIALIYHARGMNMDYARKMSKDIIGNPDQAMDILSREELGLNPKDLGSPWGAAIFSFIFSLVVLLHLYFRSLPVWR